MMMCNKFVAFIIVATRHVYTNKIRLISLKWGSYTCVYVDKRERVIEEMEINRSWEPEV